MSVKVLVPTSGGKDSQASLKLALQQFKPDEIRGLFCDTQWEHPKTYAHVEWMRQHYGVRIDTISAGSVPEKVEKYGRWPGGGARHCTDELKIRPTKMYCKALAEQQGSIFRPNGSDDERSRQASGGFEVWYGMRFQESGERTKRYAGKVCDEVYAPHDVLGKYPKYLAKMGVMFRLCILHWSALDVLEFLDGKENPLYRELAPRLGLQNVRIGCFPCGASGDLVKETAFSHDDFGAQQRERCKTIGISIGKSIFTSKSGHARNPDMGPLVVKKKKQPGVAPCAVCTYG